MINNSVIFDENRITLIQHLSPIIFHAKTTPMKDTDRNLIMTYFYNHHNNMDIKENTPDNV